MCATWWSATAKALLAPQSSSSKPNSFLIVSQPSRLKTRGSSSLRGIVSGSHVGVWAKALEIIVEMRQINETQGRLVMLLHPSGRFGDPARSRFRLSLRSHFAGGRTPKGRKRKFTQI